MNVLFYWCAAGASFITFCVHTFIGGPRVAEPLLKDTTLPIASKWLNYYCWHVVTIFTFLMGAGFAYVAMHPDKVELAIFISIVTFCSSVLSALVAIKGNINPFYFPSTTLFAVVTFFGLAGVFY